MKLLVKQLQGGECTVEVQPSTYIHEVKSQVAQQLKIPVQQQKLLFVGKTLSDDQTLQSYPTIKDGSKINLVVKKPEELSEIVLKSFKKVMSEEEAKSATQKFLNALQENFNKLSWDDVDRLAADCLNEEPRTAAPTDQETAL